ncbi:MAG: FtsQ-type POTRA domain-containing protein [Candidatus Margulisbacteria bacterium]|nr:FtsQ-type POTRA domain-containing protein [Candidatus Margulisiibacteriota bacterium]
MKKWRLAILLGVIFFGVASAFFLNNPRFVLTLVQIEGNNFVSRDQISKFTKTYMGTNVVWVRYFSYLKSDLLTAFPQIEKLKVRITYQDGITLHVKEKQPWVSFLVSDKVLLVAKDGTILNDGAHSPALENSEKLLIVRGVSPQFFTGKQVNSRLLSNIEQVVATVRRYFPGDNLQLEFKQSSFSEDGIVFEELELLKDDTIRIKLGSFDDLDVKFKLLQAYLSTISVDQQQKIQVLDIRMPPKVIIKDGN